MRNTIWNFFVVMLTIMVSVPVVAADVDGKWSGTVDTPGGQFPVNFTFKADGPLLTGSLAGPDGTEIPIKDGKIDGTSIAFGITLDFGGMPLDLSYKGVVSPEQIQFTGEAGGMPFEFVVKKVSQ